MNQWRCAATRPSLLVADDEDAEVTPAEFARRAFRGIQGTGTWSQVNATESTCAPKPYGSFDAWKAPDNRSSFLEDVETDTRSLWPSQEINAEDGDGTDGERQHGEETFQGFEGFVYQNWKLALFTFFNVFGLGIPFLILRSFPCRRIRLLGQCAHSLEDVDVMLVRIRRTVRGSIGEEYIIPVNVKVKVPNWALGMYSARWSSRVLAGASSKGPTVSRLLAQPTTAAVIIEVRQRRFLIVELAREHRVSNRGDWVRYVCLRVRSAFVPYFDDYYAMHGSSNPAEGGLMERYDASGRSICSSSTIDERPLLVAEEMDELETQSECEGIEAAPAPEDESNDMDDGLIKLDAVTLKASSIGLSHFDAETIRLVVGNNRIEVDVPPLFRLFLEQIMHPFFIFQAFSIILWCFEEYYFYSMTIASASLLSAFLEAVAIRNNAERLAKIASSDCDVLVLRQNVSAGHARTLDRVSSSELVPGDILVVESDMLLPCDCTLLSGTAIVTEASLTGEASPLFKSSWSNAFEDSEIRERQASARKASADHEENDLESAGEEDSFVEPSSYFSGAYSIANDADELLPTPSYHNVPLHQNRETLKNEGHENIGKRVDRKRMVMMESVSDVPEHYHCWERSSHVLYCGTRVIEARSDSSTSGMDLHPPTFDVQYPSQHPSAAKEASSSTMGMEAVLAVVIHTRLDTAKGNLVHNILLADDDLTLYERAQPLPRERSMGQRDDPSRMVVSRSDRPEQRISCMFDDAYRAMLFLFSLGILGTVYSFRILSPKQGLYEAFLSALDVLTIAVPPALPAAVTFGIVFAIQRLLRGGIFCIRPPAVLISAGLEAVCFDKTGTLTDLGLDIYALRPVSRTSVLSPDTSQDTMEANFEPEISFRGRDSSSESNASTLSHWIPHELSLVMSSCHTLTVVGGHVLGDEVDSRLFELTGRDLSQSTNDPEEQDLSCASNPHVFSVFDRETGRAVVRVAKVYEFSSEMSRMGVVAQLVEGCDMLNKENEWVFLMKGAPEVIVNLCESSSIPSNFSEELRHYTSRGLRVLALAGRHLLPPVRNTKRGKTNPWTPLSMARGKLERKLTLYGLAVLENRLKPDTADVLNELRFHADLHCPMVTGDHIRTAISVARQAGIIERDAQIIIVDNETHHTPRGTKSASHHRHKHTSNNVVFYDSTNVNKRYSRMDIFSMLSENARLQGHPLLFESATHPERAHDWRASGERAPLIEDKTGTVADLHASVYATNDSATAMVSTMTTPLASGAMFGHAHNEEPVALAMTGSAFRALAKEMQRIFGKTSASGSLQATTTSRRFHFLRHVFLGCSVFARMSADDKSALLRLLRSSLGICVGMCGDGANDAGALREADVGISLCERRHFDSTTQASHSSKYVVDVEDVERGLDLLTASDARDPTVKDSIRKHSVEEEDATASLAAPFTSTIGSIGAVSKVIREGRGAAAASVACFKYMGIYSLTQSSSVLYLYTVGSVYSDAQFLFQDLVLIMPLALLMGRTESCDRLLRYPPSTRLATWHVIVSIALQGIIQSIFQVLCLVALASSSHVQSESLLKPTCAWDGACAEASALFLVVNFQYIWTALAFNIGFPFRKAMFRNLAFTMVSMLLWAICTVLTLVSNPLLEHLFGIFPIHPTVRRQLMTLILLNGLVSVLVEWIIIRVVYALADRRLMSRERSMKGRW